MYRTISGEDEIEIAVDTIKVAEFSDCGNGLQGQIEEFNEPIRMSAEQMISLATWLLNKAKDRVKD